MEWLPIETAPKDDTEFLGYNPHDWVRVDLYRWNSELNEICHARNFKEPWEGLTHWMPVPEPPK